MVTSAGYARCIDLVATRPMNVSKVALGPCRSPAPFNGLLVALHIRFLHILACATVNSGALLRRLTGDTLRTWMQSRCANCATVEETFCAVSSMASASSLLGTGHLLLSCGRCLVRAQDLRN